MITILSATLNEIHRFSKIVQNPHEIIHTDNQTTANLIKGDFANKSIMLGTTGVGIRNSRTQTSLIIQKLKPELIVFTGTAGALDPDLRIGDIIVVNKVISLKRNSEIEIPVNLPYLGRKYIVGSVLTENRFVNDSEEKAKLYKATGAPLVDMESWGVMEAAKQSKTRLIIIRSVSDLASDDLPKIQKFYDENANFVYRKAFLYFFSQPRQIIKYLKFRFVYLRNSTISLNNFLKELIRKI